MAKTLQFRRGTTSELSTQSGAVGELFVDTTKDTVVVMDGSTAGGFPLQKELLSGINIKTINGQALLGSGDITISGGGSSFSGDYTDLTNKPFIPFTTSQLMNDAGFITSVKTINGQSIVGSGNLTIAGGSGSFDQELNTTDDVVFNSALIGDVSIIGNQISAIDSYGSTTGINVDGLFTVTASGGTQINTSVHDTSLTGAGYVIKYENFPNLQIGFPVQNVKSLFLAMNPGDTFTLRDPQSNQLKTFTLVTLEDNTSWASELKITVEETSATVFGDGSYLEVNYTVASTINVLEVADAGISIEGELNLDSVQLKEGKNIIQNSSPASTRQVTTTLNLDSSDYDAVSVSPSSININFNPSVHPEMNTFYNQTYGPITNRVTTNTIRVYTDQGVYTLTGPFSSSGGSSGTQVSFTYGISSPQVVYGYGGVGLTSDGATWQQYGLPIISRIEIDHVSTVIVAAIPEIAEYVLDSSKPVRTSKIITDLAEIETIDATDIVSDSALIGDVSIIGNEISGVDSYGNSDTLVVGGDLAVKFGSGFIQGIFDSSLFANKNASYTALSIDGGKEIQFSSQSGWTQEDLDKIKSLQSGTVISFRAQSQYGIATGSFTVDGVVENISYYQGTTTNIRLKLSNLTFLSGIEWMSFVTLSYIFFQWETTESAVVDVLSVTENGVNVEGTFTVNGQPVSGGGGTAYDQDLNTTDDVVFNSALVGDVSIVGNSISAVDSYGSSTDLNVDSKIITPALDVQVYTDNSVSYEAVASYGMSPYLQNYPWNRSLQIYNYGGIENSAVIAGLDAAMRNGATVNFTFNSGLGTSVGYFKIDNLSGGIGFSSTTFNFSQFVVTSGYDFYYNGSSLSNAIFTIEDIVESLPLSVTETGVAIEGTLTVNGQQITPSTPAITYDQDLNTTDDVVFNSALIGDVSIVANTLTGIDSYGNPDRIVINGDMQVSFGGQTIITGNNTVNNISLQLYSYDVSFKLPYPANFAEDFVRALYNNNPDSSPTITIAFTNASQGILEMTGRLRPASSGLASGSWGANNSPASLNNIYFDTNYINEITINGNPIANLGGYNTEFTVGNQVTFTVGEPQITTLSVTESGVNINGDLTLADNNVTPTNTSTPVKWAKIVVGGQVYYTPLYQ